MKDNNTYSQKELSKINSEAWRDDTLQTGFTSNNEVLDEQDLASIAGGVDISQFSPVELLRGAWKAGESFGQAVAGRTANGDRYSDQCS